MPDDAELTRWRLVIFQLCVGPAPRGHTFDVCREVIRRAPDRPEAIEAARTLLEGAMADALTNVTTAQDVMHILTALSHNSLDLTTLLAPP